MRIIIKIIVLVLSILSVNIFAAETDAFTPRYVLKQEGLPQVNLEINSRLKKVITKLNSKDTKTCDNDAMKSLVGETLRRPIQGVIEHHIMTTDKFPRSMMTFKDSVFFKSKSFHKQIIEIGIMLGIAFTPPIRHKDILIGADKFGHFLDEGYYYYEMYHTLDMTMENILKVGNVLEYSVEGQILGGVYSYADLAANYEGMLFWKDLLGSDKDKVKRKYIDCSEGKWSIENDVDLDIYISHAWDEGMNCSKYNTESFAKDIANNIKGLENKNKRRYECPVYPDQVPNMIKRFGKYAKSIINPKLLKN